MEDSDNFTNYILENNDNFTLSEDINGPVLSAFVALIMVTGIVANLFVIIVTFCHPKSLKQPSTIFLTSLLLVDFVFVLFLMPFNVISTASGEWIFGQSVEQKHGVCQFVGMVYWCSGLVILMTLAVISFDRFLSIVKPFIHKQYMKPHTAVIIIVIAWTICAIISSTPLYGLGKIQYDNTIGTCDPRLAGEVGFVIIFTLLMSMIVATVVITSIWTCCFTRKFMKKSQLDNNIYTSKNRRLIGIFGSLLLVCALCFGFGLSITVIDIFVKLPTVIYPIIQVCFLFITVANPLVQSFFRPDVRDALNYIFHCCSRLPHCTADKNEHLTKSKTPSTIRTL